MRLIAIKWTQIHQIDVWSSTHFDPTPLWLPRRLHIFRKICPTRKNLKENIVYIRATTLKQLRRPLGLSTPPYPLTWAHYTCGPKRLGPIYPPRQVGTHVGPHGSVSALVMPPCVRVMPRQLRAGPAHINPFLWFFNSKNSWKIIKILKKIIYLKKFITSFLELFFASKFLYWIRNLFIFNNIPLEI